MKNLHVIIVEPHEILREGLNRILNKSRFRVAGDCSSMEQLWNLSPVGKEIAAVLFDVNEHAAMTSADLERVRRTFPQAKIALMSDPAQCRRAMEVGKDADGFVFRTSCADVLVKSLELIVLGERVFPVDVWREVVSAAPPDPPPEKPLERSPEPQSPALQRARADVFERLSEREIEVMRLLCNGDPNKIIARRLGISEATVKVHVKAILRKTQAKNRTEAALLMSAFARPSAPH